MRPSRPARRSCRSSPVPSPEAGLSVSTTAKPSARFGRKKRLSRLAWNSSITASGTGRSRCRAQALHCSRGVVSHQPIHSTGRGSCSPWVYISRQGRRAWVASIITGLPAATASCNRCSIRARISSQGPCTAASPNSSARIASVESTKAGSSPSPCSRGASSWARVVLPLPGGPISRWQRRVLVLIDPSCIGFSPIATSSCEAPCRRSQDLSPDVGAAAKD